MCLHALQPCHHFEHTRLALRIRNRRAVDKRNRRYARVPRNCQKLGAKPACRDRSRNSENSVFKGSRADVGADVGLVRRRGCGRGFCDLGAIGVGQKARVEGSTRVRFSRPPYSPFLLPGLGEMAFPARFRGQGSTELRRPSPRCTRALMRALGRSRWLNGPCRSLHSGCTDGTGCCRTS